MSDGSRCPLRATADKMAHLENALRVGVLSVGQCARFANVAPGTATKWFDSGKLKGYRLPNVDGGERASDRRVPVANFVAFLREHGLPVPAELLPATLLCYGLQAGESVPGARVCDAFALGGAVAESPVRGALIGDADGMRAATCAARLIRRENPHARIVLLAGEDFSAGAVEGDGIWNAVHKRPANWLLIAREFTDTEAQL